MFIHHVLLSTCKELLGSRPLLCKVCLAQATKTETSELRSSLLFVLDNNTPAYKKWTRDGTSPLEVHPSQDSQVIETRVHLMLLHNKTPSQLQLKLCFKLCMCLSATLLLRDSWREALPGTISCNNLPLQEVSPLCLFLVRYQ